MSNTLQRQMEKPLREALTYNRVVNLVGPRQSGKSTLVRSLVPREAYLSLDDDSLREALALDPHGQLSNLRRALAPETPLVIDEVQRLPQLTLALKRIVDEHPALGPFLLTGSSDILAGKKAMDSLTGRVMTLLLYPLSSAERSHTSPMPLLDLLSDGVESATAALSGLLPVDRSGLHAWIVQGGYPAMRELPDRPRRLRHASYLDSVIERDVPALTPIRKPDAFRRVVGQLAGRVGQELNLQAVCNAVDTARDTVSQWLDLLESLHLVRRVGAWSHSPTRREVRSPKVHFVDTGLACSIRGTGTSDLDSPRDTLLAGNLVESFVWGELVRSLPLHTHTWRLYHWRRDRRAIGLVAESPGSRLVLLEVKASTQVSPNDARHLDWFMTEGPGRDFHCTGAVLYLGERTLRLSPRIAAVPLSALWTSTASR